VRSVGLGFGAELFRTNAFTIMVLGCVPGN